MDALCPSGPADALTGVQVSQATARRVTQEAGEACLAVPSAQAKQIEQEQPVAPQGATKQAVSADGAFVPLLGGVWGEVKSLVIAKVSRNQQGEICTQQPSYFSRLQEAETLKRLALVETHHRGLEKASAVCAVMDGAEWLQGLVDYHCHEAVRILDFAHAAEYVSAFAQAVSQAGEALASNWLEERLHDLKHDGPAELLTELRALHAKHPEMQALGESLAYLAKREGHMQYPAYQAAGWPIGSGMVESANKVVVEARLKGAGMHWSDQSVNAMLVVRNAVCNDRWSETWHAGRTHRRQQQRQRRHECTQARCAQATHQFLLLCLRARPPVQRTTAVPASRPLTTPAADRAASSPRPPAANHPWRRAIVNRSNSLAHAKL